MGATACSNAAAASPSFSSSPSPPLDSLAPPKQYTRRVKGSKFPLRIAIPFYKSDGSAERWLLNLHFNCLKLAKVLGLRGTRCKASTSGSSNKTLMAALSTIHAPCLRDHGKPCVTLTGHAERRFSETRKFLTYTSVRHPLHGTNEKQFTVCTWFVSICLSTQPLPDYRAMP